jgi:serine/threonine protein kinase
MPRLHSRPDPLQDLDGRLRKQIVQARLFGVDVDRRAGERYRICKRLGAGGTGIVYAARDERLGRIVALKLLRADAPTKAARDRLHREARVLARLNHPNIVAVFGLTEYEGHCALVMELVEGQSLRARVSEGGSPNAFELAVAAGRGLAAAHAAGVVHGDFKPENVLIGVGDVVVKVVDFGVARVEQGAVTW